MKFSGSRIALLFYHCGQNFQYCVVSYSWLEYVHKIWPSSLNGLNASINSKREYLPATPGEFLEVVKSPVPGQNFSAKARPSGRKTPALGTKNTYPREYFRRSGQPFLLTGVEIFGFCRNQTLKRIERLPNYYLVVPSSLKFSPSFEKEFVTIEQQ